MVDLEALGPVLLAGVVGAFMLWFFVGAQITRRRLGEAARWVYRGLEAYRPADTERIEASIKWLSTNAFNITLEAARPPLSSVVVTVLLRSRDMMAMWVLDRLSGRRDLLMLRYDLERQPIWGAEVFRPGTILSGDAGRAARQEGWHAESSGEDRLLAAHGGGKASDMCAQLLEALGEDRARLVRLSVRRASPHLTLAMDLPDLSTSDPVVVMQRGAKLAEVTLRYCTS